MKVLVATEKPFAKVAVEGIRNIVEGAGHQLSLLEKYTSNEDLYKAVVFYVLFPFMLVKNLK